MVSATLGLGLSFGICSGWILKPTIKYRACISQEKSTIQLDKNQDRNIIKETKLNINSIKNNTDDDLTPLVSALKASAKQKAATFHFPGHNRGKTAPSSLTQLIGSNPFIHDLPELPELDNLFSPQGPILEAQKLAAKLFGASETWFLVGGTTCGIQAAIMSTCTPGDYIILPRNSHISAFSAMVLTGNIPKYVIPEYDSDWDIAGGIAPSQIEKAIKELSAQGRKAAAVLITSPTYHGICSNLSDISNICHLNKIPLIVDEAHGAHLGFHTYLPPSALSQGADISIQSTHKVLTSLTQSSMLHIKGNFVNRDRISHSLQTLQTTSPSYLLLASLDAARAQISKSPEALFGKALELASKAKRMINKIPAFSVLDISSFSNFPFIDPLRINIGVKNHGISAFGADEFLYSEYGVVSELVGTKAITLAFNLGTCEEHVDRLIFGLQDLSSRYFLNQGKVKKVEKFPPFPSSDVRMRMSPREAFFAGKRKVRIDESIGKVCGELVCPYPPGIPILYPGEVITKEALDYLGFVRSNGAVITGATDSILICND